MSRKHHGRELAAKLTVDPTSGSGRSVSVIWLRAEGMGLLDQSVRHHRNHPFCVYVSCQPSSNSGLPQNTTRCSKHNQYMITFFFMPPKLLSLKLAFQILPPYGHAKYGGCPDGFFSMLTCHTGVTGILDTPAGYKSYGKYGHVLGQDKI